MSFPHRIRLSLLLATCLGYMGISSAQEGSFSCGTLDESFSLAKAAALPKVNKVWSGTLKALVIRIAFSDGAYGTDTAAIVKTNTTINQFYATMSRNTFQWTFKIHPVILQAPNNKATYAANFASLQTWIAAQITAQGLKRGVDYDVYIANFPQLSLDWAGLSNLRDADWINGSYGSGVTAHELGHSLGLPHAHSIEAGSDMFGTPGTDSQTVEYGNPYDVMGRGGINAHFNVLYKLRVGWEDPEEIQEVSSSGTYRIYAHDNALHKSRLIGIRVPSGNSAYAYWCEYRSLSTSTRNGATVTFQGFTSPTNLESWYLDTTPGSRTNNDENDGILSVGKQFKDKYGETLFKTLAVNANTWTEEGWVDVQVTLPQTGNLRPLVRNRFSGVSEGKAETSLNLLGRFSSGSLDHPGLKSLKSKKEHGGFQLTLERP